MKTIALATSFLALLTACCNRQQADAPVEAMEAADPPVAVAPDGPDYVKPDEATLRERLTPLQYRVTQEAATERPFENEYWDNHEAGLYVDVVSGEPLFTSLDKYDSGCGWPSFTRPVSKSGLSYESDHKLFYERTEVRSQRADSHLGHVFDDGPGPTGKRYCINSAALRFIPVRELKAAGYEEYLSLFE